MNFKELDAYMMSKQGVTHDYPFDEEVRAYRIAEKMFALTKDAHPLEVNLKCDPIYALELRSIYEGVRAGYHMNKKHWNTLTLEDGDIDNETVKELIDHSYELVYKSLTKKKREALGVGMKYISLLRGINVSGQKKILMKDLKALYESLGFSDVMTYIQSGNVLFFSELKLETVIAQIEEAISMQYGFDVPVQVREVSDFESIIRNCPFPELDLVEEGTRVMLTFLEAEPTDENVEKLMTYVKEPERLVLVGREVYLHCPNGYGTTKLNNNFLEKKLKVRATTRNWKSVVKLCELGTA